MATPVAEVLWAHCGNDLHPRNSLDTLTNPEGPTHPIPKHLNEVERVPLRRSLKEGLPP